MFELEAQFEYADIKKTRGSNPYMLTGEINFFHPWKTNPPRLHQIVKMEPLPQRFDNWCRY